MTDDPRMPEDDLEMPEVDAPNVKQHEVSDSFGYDIAFKFAFVGLGQGGGRIAETFHSIGYRRVCVINSSRADLDDVTDDIAKLDLGTGGAGQDMEKGAQFLQDRDEDVWDLLTRAVGDDPEYLLICASLGGGTGSGGLKKLLEICRAYMSHKECDPLRVGVIVSLPDTYEGQRTARNAVVAYKELNAAGPSPIIIIDNKRIAKLFPKKGSTDLFPTCNQQVAKMFHLFNRLAIQRSKMITFDRADFAELLNSGVIAFGASPVPRYETKADITEVIRDQLSKTVLAEVNLKKGRLAGCIFLGGEKVMAEIPMPYFGDGFAMLGRQLADNSVIYRGVYVGNTDDLRCYTMISGLPGPATRLAELIREAKLEPEAGGTAEELGIQD